MIEYRRAAISDIEDLIRLRMDFTREVQKIKNDDGDKTLSDSLREYFSSTMPEDGFIAWLAEYEGQIVATSGLCFYKLPPSFKNLSGNMAYIMNMYTIPEFRGKGIAKVLFEKILTEAKALGFKKISLHATEMGRPIYEKFGFKGIDTEMALNL